VQLCIVHMVRHSLNYVSWKRRKEVAVDFHRILTHRFHPILTHPG